MASSLHLHMISTAPAATQNLSKSPLSSLNHITSFIEGVNNGVTISSSRRRRTFRGGNLSAAYGGSSRVRGLRYFNGKSKSSTICCNSLLTSDIASTASSVSAAYGVLLLGGGLFAYTRTGSKGSLVGGLTGGAIMSTAYFLMQASETKDIGVALAFGSALLFASVFGIRLAATRKVMPAAPLLGLSIAALAVFVSAYMQDRLLM